MRHQPADRGQAGPLATGWMYGPLGQGVRLALQELVLFPLMHTFTPIRVRGRDHFQDAAPPVLIVSNHVSHLDTPTLLQVIPLPIRRRLVIAAASDYFYRGKIRGGLVSFSLAAVPFDRRSDSQASLAGCEDLLRRGWSLLIFPEGTRSPTGEFRRVRRGAAVLAVDTGTPVVPVFVHGLAQVLPKGAVAPLPAGVLVDVGEVIRPSRTDSIDKFRGYIECALAELASRRPDWGATTSRYPELSREAHRAASREK